jgi:uncharacterized protein YbcV (DUF1398 family)
LATMIAASNIRCICQTHQLTKNQDQMFTIEQIKTAHAKVKSGADYPAYVQDIIQLGVNAYTTYVKDGNTFYEGSDNYRIHSGPKYPELQIADASDAKQFLRDLKSHQSGKSDFQTFCRQAAANGVEKWVVDTKRLTCTYYGKQGEMLLAEKIPLK